MIRKSAVLGACLAASILLADMADARAGKCNGILHSDHDSLYLGGGKGEGEGICVVHKSQVRKVLARCAIGRRCELVGQMRDCQDSGECVEITNITSVHRR